MTVQVSIRAGFLPVRVTATGGGGEGADPANAAFADDHNGHRVFQLKSGDLTLMPNESIDVEVSLGEALTLAVIEEDPNPPPPPPPPPASL